MSVGGHSAWGSDATIDQTYNGSTASQVLNIRETITDLNTPVYIMGQELFLTLDPGTPILTPTSPFVASFDLVIPSTNSADFSGIALNNVTGTTHFQGSGVPPFVMSAMQFSAWYEGTQKSPSVIGVQAVNSVYGGGATLLESFLGQEYISTSLTDTVIGLHLYNPSVFGGGSISTRYAIKIEDQSAATTNYAIATGTGLVSFGDDVRIANGKALKTDTTTAHTALLQAYDVNGTTYRTFATLTNGDVPSFTVSQPSGGVLALIPPTADPHVVGAIWNNSGTLAISAG
jgi:hypothetical protein